MPIPSPKLPCHDAFGAAKAERNKYPLKSGLYKLYDARRNISRMQESMCAIGDYLNGRHDCSPGGLLGPCCTTDDKAVWIKDLPKQVARNLGYDILPAIEALTGDGIAASDVKGELARARAEAERLLDDCETQHKRLKSNIDDEYRAMKSGYSDVYALLFEAKGIAHRALELVEWVEERRT